SRSHSKQRNHLYRSTDNVGYADLSDFFYNAKGSRSPPATTSNPGGTRASPCPAAPSARSSTPPCSSSPKRRCGSALPTSRRPSSRPARRWWRPRAPRRAPPSPCRCATRTPPPPFRPTRPWRSRLRPCRRVRSTSASSALSSSTPSGTTGIGTGCRKRCCNTSPRSKGRRCRSGARSPRRSLTGSRRTKCASSPRTPARSSSTRLLSRTSERAASRPRGDRLTPLRAGRFGYLEEDPWQRSERRRRDDDGESGRSRVRTDRRHDWSADDGRAGGRDEARAQDHGVLHLPDRVRRGADRVAARGADRQRGGPVPGRQGLVVHHAADDRLPGEPRSRLGGERAEAFRKPRV